MTEIRLSRIIEEQIKKPSPIRQIMKMADRKNIIKMGLNPDDVISFGGGWVNHEAPELMRKKYMEIAEDPARFHESGAYSPTPGYPELREQLAIFEERIFGVKEIGAENIIVGQSSTQMTHDLFVSLADPGDKVILLDPTYANYSGQIDFVLAETKGGGGGNKAPDADIVHLNVFDPEEWKYLPDEDKVLKDLEAIIKTHRPRMIIIPSPDNPTSQIMPHRLVKEIMEMCEKNGIFVMLDFAYKAQYFSERPPEYFSWSPEEYPHMIAMHSNSKWARGLGRRLGWIEADPKVIEAMERVQQCSILCPDTLHQMAITEYLQEAIPSGELKRYLDDVRHRYKATADVTLKAIDEHLGMRRLVPQGGLYTVMDVGMDADKFMLEVLKNTGVLFIPGGGFGESIKNGVRISYGPLINDHDKIREGMERVGEFVKGM